jgi:hypothetical protein
VKRRTGRRKRRGEEGRRRSREYSMGELKGGGRVRDQGPLFLGPQSIPG